jgi:hypothetical protein
VDICKILTWLERRKGKATANERNRRASLGSKPKQWPDNTGSENLINNKGHKLFLLQNSFSSAFYKARLRINLR